MANNASMLALLGLFAVVGYQNRDKIAAAIDRVQSPNAAGGSGAGGLGGLMGDLGGLLGGVTGSGGGLGGLLSGVAGAGAGGNILSGGLGDLMNSFQNAGHGQVAQSWVDPAVPTQGLTPQQVEQAVGDANLTTLAQQTGLSRQDLLKRLATAIPQTVDKLTPNGQMPATDAEARQNLTA